MNWKNFYDNLAREYGNSCAASGWWNTAYFRAVQKTVLDLMCEDVTGPIADIGCGPGLLLKPFMPPFHIAGLDISGEMLALARQNYTVPVMGDCRMIPLKSESFHAVTCTGVIQTLDNPVPVIKELARITHPQGYIIVVTHNSHSCIRKLAPRKGFTYLPKKELVEQAFFEQHCLPVKLLGIHYPSLKSLEIKRFSFFHKYFCTTLIWKFKKEPVE